MNFHQNVFQKKPLKTVKRVVAVGSGKGGVGKSTVSVNLALALRQEGWKMGLLDADIYGPSLPRLMGVSKRTPALNEKTQKLFPIPKLGVQIMSMGFLLDEEAPVIWRGPMLFKAIQQFFFDVEWGDLDGLIVDLPPGTGDVVLTMAQKIPVSGAIVVCTPQNLALLDAKKAISMFEKLNIPLIGLVENMSAFYPKGEENEPPIDLFPKGDLDLFIKTKGIAKLASVPFHPDVGLSSESGMPIVESDPRSLEAKNFKSVAKNLIDYFLKEESTVSQENVKRKETQKRDPDKQL